MKLAKVYAIYSFLTLNYQSSNASGKCCIETMVLSFYEFNMIMANHKFLFCSTAMMIWIKQMLPASRFLVVMLTLSLFSLYQEHHLA